MNTNADIKARAVQAVENSEKKLGVTAKEIGTSYSTLWNFLYGKTGNFGSLDALATACGVKLDWLLSGTESPDTGAAKLAAAQMIAAKAVTELAAPSATSASLRAFVMKRVADTLSASDAIDFEALITAARKDAEDFAKAMGEDEK